MNNIKVSVIMPNYNGARFLREAIESVLQQTFTDFEFILIDDGSTDNSWDIISQCAEKDRRLVIFRNQKNLRICQTLNQGLKMAQGEYIARMDSDDVAQLDWLEKMVEFMEQAVNKKVGVCGANFFIIDECGKKIGEKKFPQTNEACRKSFWFRNPFGHNTVLIRKECFDELGDYDENFIYAEDLELWMRFGQKYQFHNIQKYLVSYRIFGENSVLKKQKAMIESTLKARSKARKEYGYQMNFLGQVFFLGTWLMKWMPVKWVFWMFNFFKQK